jgi:hypothetical protein
MAGSPKKRALLIELSKRARSMFGPPAEGEPEPSVLDYACGYIASGGTLYALAEDLKPVIEVSRAFLKQVVEESEGSDAEHVAAARQRLAHARAESADSHAESGISLLDKDLKLTKDEVLHRRILAERKAWLASRYNRAVYGEDKQPLVAISLPNLHLDAVRYIKAMGSGNPASHDAHALSGEVTTDYEVLPADAGSGAGMIPPPPPAPAGSAGGAD